MGATPLLNQRLGLNAGAFAVPGTPTTLRKTENGTQLDTSRNPAMSVR